ncbi:hypothetical protein MKK88_04685 [Methylobacterium sp. E-005]|uniref:tyrosine-type recombinase/integrase n=1 Tax=Methylobacterium sp. E-005 TaxID=2836549 RepID=UPI001FBBC5B4|nr:integrase family protein [Methylobacterium sp. E-005]MCJ2085293.1 hypothetical protein [Methylobacterium sp. E-005]
MPRAKAAPKAPPKPKVDWPPRGAVDITATFIERAGREQRPGVAAVDVRDSRAQGLLLRVSPRTVTWGWKAERFGKTMRLNLGPVDGLTIAQARAICTAATTMLRSGNGLPTDRWLVLHRVEMGLTTPEEAYPDIVHLKPLKAVAPRTWTYTKAVDEYLAAHADEWRKAAHDDARKVLRHPVLRRFAPLPVATITPDDLQPILGEKAKTHHRQSEAIFVRLRHFYTWLATPGPRRDSGVPKGWLDDLQRPKKPKAKEGEAPRGQRVRFPTMDRVGLLVALARTDLLEPRFSAAVMLLVSTVQRRRAIATARLEELAPVPDQPGWGIWRLPPVRRKTGERASAQAHHAVPLPPPVWSAVREQVERAGEGPWLFPGMRPRRAGVAIEHLSESAITHLLAALPVDASPHDLRRAFRSHGARTLRLPDSTLDLILDHAEGVAPGSVSERHYADDDRLDLKIPVATAWWTHVEEYVATARFDLDKVRADFLVAKARQKGREFKPPASAAAAAHG